MSLDKKVKDKLTEHFNVGKGMTDLGATKKRASKDEKKDDGGPHLGDDFPELAVLGKKNEYRETGYYYVKTQPGRMMVYTSTNVNTNKVFGSDALFMTDGCMMSSSKAANFNKRARDNSNKKKKSNQQYPYKWQAHHILPGEVFKTGEVFEYAERQVLKRTDYNINRGENIIMLPGSGANMFVSVHSLLQHPTNHVQYTAQVKDSLSTINDELKKIVKKEKKHDKVKSNFLGLLSKLENAFWQQIVATSHAAVTAVILQQELLSDDIVKDQNYKGLKWPRLG